MTEDERIAVMSQKLEPRLRDDRNNRPKVICIRMYPKRTKRMSRESAFWGKLEWCFFYCQQGNYLCQIPKTNDERAKSITDPTATLLH